MTGYAMVIHQTADICISNSLDKSTPEYQDAS